MFKENGICTVMATTHVDDIALSGPTSWIDRIDAGLNKRFGKTTRQRLPFSHCGCEYIKVNDGFKICQREFAEKVKPAPIPQGEEFCKLTNFQTSGQYLEHLGAILWLTATRLDLIAGISLLQSRVAVMEGKDLKQANAVGSGNVIEFKDMGLYYRHLQTNHRRLMCLTDASSASKG